MCLPAVELDDQANLRPEEVNDESIDGDIHLGLGKAVAAQEGEEPRLELAAGVVGLELPNRQPQELGLAKGSNELWLRKNTPEIAERPRGRGHRDVFAAVVSAGASLRER
jgi:hypothetical protein